MQCTAGIYEVHITSLPDHSDPVSWQDRIVVRVDSCMLLMCLVDMVRHSGGSAHFGPEGECGFVDERARERGRVLLDDVYAQSAQIRRMLEQARMMKDTAHFN